MPKKIRVVIIDDHLVIRRGFATFLKTDDQLELVGEGKNGREAIALCNKLEPDVVLMDIMMPEMDGIDAITTIRQTHPHIQIIALTSFNNDAQLVKQALDAGAIGYLFKDVSVEDLSSAVRNANNGTPTISPGAMKMLLRVDKKPTIQDFNLSEREVDVLRLLIDGLTNSQIAQKLDISKSTAKFHVSSILGKIGASSRTEAVSIALKHDLIK